MLNSTERFSSRVENYVRYRPHYPTDVLACLQRGCGLRSEDVVADVGSGTGILAALLLGNGNRVFGVEPNREMREAGERLLQNYAGFISVNATAEATTLPDDSVAFVTAGQAFHWFDAPLARAEFKRILRPDGWVVLVWNERPATGTALAGEYERLLQTYAPDYEQVNHKKRADAETIRRFFDGDFTQESFSNPQSLDYEALKGRLLSSSYSPEAGHPQHLPMLAELRRLFEAHQEGGQVSFDYETHVFYGHLK